MNQDTPPQPTVAPVKAQTPMPPSGGSSSKEWPTWVKVLRIYSIVYIILMVLLFIVVGLASGSSSNNNSSSSGSGAQVAAAIMGVLFIPVLVFLFSVHSPEN